MSKLLSRKGWRPLLTLAILAVASASTSAAEQFSVDYRTTSWKTLHFGDAKIADQCQADMVSLGCEIRKELHGDHHDVSYQCAQWRRKVVTTHAEAHQWENWLKTNGFETRHSH